MSYTVRVMAANYNTEPTSYYTIGVKAPSASSFSWSGDLNSYSTRYAQCSVPDEYYQDGRCLVDVRIGSTTKRMWVYAGTSNVYDDFYGNNYDAGLQVSITGGLKGNIFVDGTQKGTNTSSINMQIASGQHTVKVISSGYRTYSTTVSIASGTIAKVVAALDLPMGKVYVKTTPSGASLQVV